MGGSERREERDVLSYLLEQRDVTVPEVSAATGIKRGSLYSMIERGSKRVDIRTLKLLADYFNEDLSIFCGLEGYTPPLRLEEREQRLLEAYRALPAAARDRVDELVKDPPKPLTGQEQELLAAFGELTDTAKRRVAEMAEDIASNPKNRRSGP